MRYRLLIGSLIALFFTTALNAQKTMNAPFELSWKKADSLMDRGLPKSASEIARRILQEAAHKKDEPNKIKAQLFLMNAAGETEEYAEEDALKEAEQEIAGASGAEKAIWQSIAAQMYWNYYQHNRYQLLNRTALEETKSDDPDTWDAPAFFRKITALYQASISNRVVLQQIPVEQYAPLIIKGVHTRNLRPTLYDLLVFRALDFFQNEEKDVVNPAYHFVLDGLLWFEPAERFASVKVKVKDAASMHFQALTLYQELIAFHLKDAQPEALIDADLQRLQFVHAYSVNPEKDSLYLDALKALENKYVGNPAVAEVSFQIAVQQLGSLDDGPRPSYRPGPRGSARKSSRDIPAIKKQLQGIVTGYPDSEGGVHARNLLLSLEASSLNLQVEAVNIPQQNMRALVTYKNTGKVYLSLFQVPQEIDEARYEAGDYSVKEIAKWSPLRSWTQNLPGSEDMEQHATEIKVAGLPGGSYLLVASLEENLSDSKNLVTVAAFQVSALSLITRSGYDKDTQFWVLNRKSGRPVADVEAIFWTRNYNSQLRKYVVRKSGTARSDEQGELHTTFNMQNAASLVTLVSGEDTLQTGAQYFYNYRVPQVKDQVYTFFFTDRSLYRPGQTVYFKGIMVKNTGKGRKSEVLAGAKATIGFYDANGQKIAATDLVTNDFGSFTGTFTAPESGLTGQMSIRGENGQVSLSVEEYKRPKFYVAWDTLKGDYALNQRVHIKGFAKAYAGNTIDGAAVKYRVVRRASFPFYWAFYRWGMPSSPEMEVTNGMAKTGADGSFELEFQTIPDQSIDPETLPVFTYEVYVEITDINGETRSGSQSLKAGYVSLQIAAGLKIDSRPADLDSIQIATQNLNGVFVPARIQVSMAPLRFPGKIYRERLWDKPDQFAMTETEFRQAFPNDEYRDEGDYHNWEKESPVFETSYTTEADSRISIPPEAFKHAGWYVLKISAKDKGGKDVVEKKYTYISIPGENQTVQKPLVVQLDQERYEPGETAKMELAVGFGDVYLLNASSVAGSFSKPGRFDIRIGEDGRGGIEFTWLYVYNNRVYTVTSSLSVPWSNKDLQLEWASHRDKLLPGAQETWTLTIKGNKSEQVAAELVAGMYDASLDAFKPHVWRWDQLNPQLYFNAGWKHPGFDVSGSRVLKAPQALDPVHYNKRYDRLDIPGFHSNRRTGIYYMSQSNAAQSVNARREMKVMEKAAEDNSTMYEMETGRPAPAIPAQDESDASAPVAIRKNLRETVFFFPQLKADAKGNVQFQFTMPEALTEWKLMAFAHTRDWKTGYLEGKIKTQKDLMVMPNLPRFLRQGDDLVISTKISNLSDKALAGTATLELLDAQTLQPVGLPFRLGEENKHFSVEAGQSAEVSWSVHVPESRYMPVVLRISAKAGNFTDGEENTLAVITNRVLVTETLPLPVRGNETRHFSFDKLKNQNSSTLLNHALTVEFTGNPAWYAVQALPYLMEYPYECAEQTFNRFYANALASHIVARSPKIEQIFNQWKITDTAALLSNLERNQELKSALLEETPWVMDAKDETEQKHRIALLFETHQLAKGLKQNLQKLEQMQLPEGAFPWFNGMHPDRYITQYIVTGIARLQHLGVENADDKKAQNIISKALPYLDEQIKLDYDNLLKANTDLSHQHIGPIQVQYLYMRSFYVDQQVPAASKKAFAYYQQQAAAYWNKFSPYLKGMIALALNRLEDNTTPQQIIASLKETAVNNEETGMYWKDMPHGYWWYEAPIESQALLVEAFSEVTRDEQSTGAIKVWLLKQKQTQNWETTKATADACYALLLNGSDWLVNKPQVTIQLGTKIIRSSEIKTEAGTGYFKERIPGAAVKPEMGNIEVTVDQVENEGVSWGAVYWQYFEDMDKVTSAETPLSLRKQLFIERNTDRGPVLTEIKDGNALRVGDKVKVRIELRVDRDMEYVHLKDMRAACFEPLHVLSGYRYQGGLGYYESTKDVSSNFFFDYLPKGTYVFEYPVFVGQKGDFSNGISTIQCMYAPEFSSHSEGIRIQVR